jgi:hypothetical protein
VHQGDTHAPTARSGRHRDRLDIPAGQFALVDPHSSRYDGRVSDEGAVELGQDVDAAERVIPVVVGEVTLERVVEQCPQIAPEGVVELSTVETTKGRRRGTCPS